MTGTWPGAEAFKFLGKIITVFTVDGRAIKGTIITLDINVIRMRNEQGEFVIMMPQVTSLFISNEDTQPSNA